MRQRREPSLESRKVGTRHSPAMLAPAETAWLVVVEVEHAAQEDEL
jgi:hypothetical protein